jgi:hypothetical protein
MLQLCDRIFLDIRQNLLPFLYLVAKIDAGHTDTADGIHTGTVEAMPLLLRSDLGSELASHFGAHNPRKRKTQSIAIDHSLHNLAFPYDDNDEQCCLPFHPAERPSRTDARWLCSRYRYVPRLYPLRANYPHIRPNSKPHVTLARFSLFLNCCIVRFHTL